MLPDASVTCCLDTTAAPMTQLQFQCVEIGHTVGHGVFAVRIDDKQRSKAKLLFHCLSCAQIFLPNITDS